MYKNSVTYFQEATPYSSPLNQLPFLNHLILLIVHSFSLFLTFFHFSPLSEFSPFSMLPLYKWRAHEIKWAFQNNLDSIQNSKLSHFHESNKLRLLSVWLFLMHLRKWQFFVCVLLEKCVYRLAVFFLSFLYVM